MSPRSSSSDIYSQLVYARVEESVRETPPSLLVDSTDLRNIGAHLASPTTENLYPDDIEVSESETPSRSKELSLTPRPTDARVSSQDHKVRPPSGLPSTPTLSPAERGPSLTPYEFQVLKRRKSAKRKRTNSSGHSSTSSHTDMRNRRRCYYHSPCTTIDIDVAPAPRAATPFSISHTPSHHSESTVDDEVGEDAEHAEGPRPPHPYSEYDPYDPRYGRDVVDNGK